MVFEHFIELVTDNHTRAISVFMLHRIDCLAFYPGSIGYVQVQVRLVLPDQQVTGNDQQDVLVILDMVCHQLKANEGFALTCS